MGITEYDYKRWQRTISTFEKKQKIGRSKTALLSGSISGFIFFILMSFFYAIEKGLKEAFLSLQTLIFFFISISFWIIAHYTLFWWLERHTYNQTKQKINRYKDRIDYNK